MYSADRMELLKQLLIIAGLLLGSAANLVVLLLVLTTKRLRGYAWLAAAAGGWFLTEFCYRLLPVLADHHMLEIGNYQGWQNVLRVLSWFTAECFGIFVLAQWSASRVRLSITQILFSFSGRAPRSIFWLVWGILFPWSILISFVPIMTKAHGAPWVMIWLLYVCIGLLHTWMALAVYTKRWHDCEKSGLMTLVLLIPLAGPVIFLVYQGFVRGTLGANRYGEDPRLDALPAPPSSPQFLGYPAS